MLVVLGQDGGIAVVQPQAGGPFPGGAEPDRLGELHEAEDLSEQAAAGPEVGPGDGVGPAAARVGVDHLPVGNTKMASSATIATVTGSTSCRTRTRHG